MSDDQQADLAAILDYLQRLETKIDRLADGLERIMRVISSVDNRLAALDGGYARDGFDHDVDDDPGRPH